MTSLGADIATSLPSPRIASYAVARGRHALLGHTPALLRSPLTFLRSLQGQADIVRVDFGTTKTLFLTAPDLIQVMLTDRDAAFEKGRFYDKVRPLAGNGIVLAQGAEHTRQLLMIKPAFSRAQVEAYTLVMNDVLKERLHGWSHGSTLAVDREMHVVTLRILARTMFGSTVGQDTAERIAALLPDVLRAIMLSTLDPGDIFSRLPLPINRRLARAHAELRSTIGDAMINHRSSPGASTGDMLSTLLSAHDEAGHSLTEDELRDQIVAVTMAGSETAATAMAWMFYELSRRPDVEERLFTEVTEVLGDRPCTAADVAHLPYCRRVLQEVLRIRQPIMVISRRATRDISFGGGTLSAGGELFYSPFAVFRDPTYFAKPMEFCPDRWLTTPTHLLPRGIYTPFGGGPRHCVGEHFAWVMMTVVLSTVVRRWRLRLVPGIRIHEKPWATINPSSMPMTANRR